ncbi:MAG: phosphopantetheine-binding protein [Bryobacteraceae bacterium]|jgi:acyl carrier protein
MGNKARITRIVKQVAAEPVDPAPGDSLFESGLLDSFSLADLVTELEKEFAIKVPDSDLVPRKFDSIDRIEAYVASRV